VGEGLALDAAWLLAAFLVILVLVAAGIAARRFLLERGGGTVECGLRSGNGSWRLGVARYRGEELRWYGIFGLSVRPDEVFPRRDLAVVSRRLPTEAEAVSLGPGMIVVECRLGEDTGAGPGADSGPEASSDSGAASAEGAAAEGSGASPAAGPGAASRHAVTVELALGEAALTGLLAWLEASPPGSHLGIAI
jgi:Protein of unknown function (DUF2550)